MHGDGMAGLSSVFMRPRRMGQYTASEAAAIPGIWQVGYRGGSGGGAGGTYTTGEYLIDRVLGWGRAGGIATTTIMKISSPTGIVVKKYGAGGIGGAGKKTHQITPVRAAPR